MTLSLTEILDRVRTRATIRECQKSAAIDGRRERGIGRQHHHLAHQAGLSASSWLSTPISTPSKRCMAWVTAGSSASTACNRRSSRSPPSCCRWAGLPTCARTRDGVACIAGKCPEASADTIAQALSAEPARVFREEDSGPFETNQADLDVDPLQNQPLLDGYRDDWNVSADPQPLPGAAGYPARSSPASPSATCSCTSTAITRSSSLSRRRPSRT